MSAAAAIIAGGRATRFGGRIKAHLEVEGRRIIDRQLEVLRPLFADIAVCSDDAAPYADTGLPVLADAVPNQGPLGGIVSALEWSPRSRVFAVACDMPFLDARVIELLLARSGELVVPIVAGRPDPLHAVYSRSALEVVRARLARGRRKVASLLDELHAVRVEERELRALDAELRCLCNLNSMSDLKNLSASVSS
jgi:molybdopterin-guanine dinucleotide biosynthesis protein A